MLPLCADSGIGLIPWSPLARGRLARAWSEETPRTRTDSYGNALYASTVDSDRRIVDEVAAIASARGVPNAQIALAWLTQKPIVSAPIIGASRIRHLEDAVAALTLNLTAAEVARMEAPYVPHAVVGHS
jgi:aryl-alcohol dehydrogenase-like predicted oxidoreductase